MSSISRINLITSYFQKKNQLTVANPVYAKTFTTLWNWLIEVDDVGNDITTKTLKLTGNATAHIIAKQSGIIAGITEISFLISSHIPRIRLMRPIPDSSLVKSGDTILTLSGSIAEILKFERTILNILGRMSGIATETQSMIKLIKNHTPFIAATRKTPWMQLDKKAVALGGGLTHRLSLSDSILIKDNHFEVQQNSSSRAQRGDLTMNQDVVFCIQKMFENGIEFFELEVTNLSQAHTALSEFSRRYTLDARRSILALLLDNWTPPQVKKFIEKVKKDPIYPHVFFEASGEISKENIVEWSTTGVDILSVGALTHSLKNFNLSLQIL